MRHRALFLPALLLLTSPIAVWSHQTTTLEPGKTIERAINGGDTHSYNFTLAPGSYTAFEVDQKGINLSVMIYAPDGQTLRAVDLRNPGLIETVSFISEGSTTYRVDVVAPHKSSRGGNYAIKFGEPRQAADNDKARVEAQRLLETSMQLLLKQTAASRQEVVERAQQSVAHWRKIKEKSNEAYALYLMAYTFNVLTQHPKAEATAEKGLAVARDAGDREMQAFMFDEIGSSYNGRGERKTALGFFLQALALRTGKDRVALGNTLNNIGLTYGWMGQRAKSLEYFERVVTIMHEAGDRLKESTVMSNICSINTALSLYKKAFEFCEQSLKIKREIADKTGEAVVLNAFGNIYAALGDYQKALDHYQQAFDIHKTRGEKAGEGVTLNNIGWVYDMIGERERAIQFYSQALPAFREIEYRSGIATVLGNVGAIYADLNDYSKALEVHLEALTVRSESHEAEGRAITLTNIASSYAKLGERQKALDHFAEAIALHRSIKSQRKLANTLRSAGVFHLEERETSKALEYLNEARTIAHAIGDRNSEADVLSNLARLERDRGNLLEARKLIEEAIAAIESIRVDLKSHQLRTSFLATTRKYYEFDIDVLMRLHKERPNEGFATAALQVSEKSRARSLLELLREARTEIRQGVDPLLIEREDFLRRTIAERAEQQTRLLSGKHAEEDAAAATKEMEELTSEYDQVQTRIRQASPRYAALVEPQPMNVEAIQKRVVDENTLLLEYALGEDRSFVWAVTSAAVKSFELPGRAAIERLARRFHQVLMERGVSVSGETIAQRTQRLDKADAEYPQAAEELSRILLGPVAAELKQKRLAIVAEGVLQHVPFAALPSPDAKVFQPLIVEHEIVTLPSASVLAVLREEFANRKPASKAVAVLADPVFSASDPRLSSRGGEVVEDSSFIDVQRSAAESGLGSLVRLRFSRQEADEIARLAGGGRNLKALDFSANRAMATDARLGDYRIVHFATHGLINNQHPGLSGIVLSLVDQQGRPQNGFLRLYDVYNLKLNADLVVLSACQSALGKEIKGEGLVGLTRGFMYAGAPRVVASFWRIDDRATADIMRRFYTSMLKDGLSPAAALRAAQISMLRERRWHSPHYWAAFTLQGDWRQD